MRGESPGQSRAPPPAPTPHDWVWSYPWLSRSARHTRFSTTCHSGNSTPTQQQDTLKGPLSLLHTHTHTLSLSLCPISEPAARCPRGTDRRYQRHLEAGRRNQMASRPWTRASARARRRKSALCGSAAQRCGQTRKGSSEATSVADCVVAASTGCRLNNHPASSPLRSLHHRSGLT
ncbi:hypothetical protein VTN02DRAFT_5227 [Thermoascus thermophilus]